MKIVSKLLLTIETDVETGEIKLLNREVINDDLKPVKKTSKKKEENTNNSEPLVTLDTNKLILTQGAVDLLEICEDCRVDIKYKKKDKTIIPIIGTDSSFGTKSGKSN